MLIFHCHRRRKRKDETFSFHTLSRDCKRSLFALHLPLLPLLFPPLPLFLGSFFPSGCKRDRVVVQLKRFREETPVLLLLAFVVCSFSSFIFSSSAKKPTAGRQSHAPKRTENRRRVPPPSRRRLALLDFFVVRERIPPLLLTTLVFEKIDGIRRVSVAHSLSARLFVVVLPLLLLIEKLSSRMRDATF